MDCVALGDDLFSECSGAPVRDWADVDGGESFSVGVTRDGDVVAWGTALYGELGDETRDGTAPLVASLRVPVKCASVACGLNHALALSMSGDVFAWGRNHRGQAARGPSDALTVAEPTKVASPCGKRLVFSQLAAGGAHSLAVDSVGALWAWGDNAHGQLGIFCAGGYDFVPRRVVFPLQVEATLVGAGYAHSAVGSLDGRVYTFGWGLYHQLGHGSTDDTNTPQLVEALDGIDGGMIALACGTWHTVAISSQGDVYSWGWGPDGQLGPSHGASERLPRVVDTEDGYFSQDGEDHVATHVSCGARFTMVGSRAGKLFCWGRKGELFISTSEQTLQHKRIQHLAAGHSHALILATDC